MTLWLRLKNDLIDHSDQSWRADFQGDTDYAPAPRVEDPMATVQRWFILWAFCLPLANVLFGLQFNEVQYLHFCFTFMGYQRSFRPSSPSCCLRGAAP